jgi:hypothetical protein
MMTNNANRAVPACCCRTFRSAELVTGRIRFLLLALWLLPCCPGRAEETVSIFAPTKQPMLEFALGDLRSALTKRGVGVQTAARDSADIVLLDAAAYRSLSGSSNGTPKVDFDFKPEEFSLQKADGGRIWVIGADDAGLMYGALELAEQIRLHGRAGVLATSQNPHLAERGVKFNIPLDLRTPTYTDPSEASQQNMAEMWSMDFWTGFIDRLARHRYNMISLWNLHPFPSMVKVPEYPDIALNDVVRTKVPIRRFYELGNGQTCPDLMRDTEVIKRITIEEKIEFWRAVMRYARERNVKFYLMTWNIFDWGIEGKYGIDIRAENPVTRDYYRKSVKQLLRDRFPEVDGQVLFEAWQEASSIYPLTTGFHWGAADFSWYIEGCRSHPAGANDKIGYQGVEQFIVQPVHPGTKNQTIPDYVKTVGAGRTSPLKSPLQVAAELHAHVDRAQQRLAMFPAACDPELANTLGDIRCISLLGRYYAHKIAGATHLVHFHFNTSFGGVPTHAEEHRKSMLWTAVLFGMIKEENADDGFFDVSRSPEEKAAAIKHLAREIGKSTADRPLMIFCGGGVQVPCSALELAIAEGASPAALKAVTFVSHSIANERDHKKGHPEYERNWSVLIRLSPHPRFLDHTSPLVNGRRTGEPVKGDQNNTARNQGPRKGLAGMPNWQWLAAYGPRVEGFGFSGTKGEWLLTRLKAAGAPELGHNGNAEADASDAGMVFGQMPGGKTDATMDDIRAFFLGSPPFRK